MFVPMWLLVVLSIVGLLAGVFIVVLLRIMTSVALFRR